jgi:hypothetical protein
MNRVLKEPKYYFVYYECETSSVNIRENGVIKSQKLIDIHPLKWQIEVNEKYGDWHKKSGDCMRKENCTVISWQKLTVEEYNEFKDKIG